MKHIHFGMVLFLVVGCGSSTVKVSGTVTRGGQPADGGLVVFEPAAGGGTSGPGGGAKLMAGRFELDGEMRLPPGRYLVRVVPPEPRIPDGPNDPIPAQPPPWSTVVDVTRDSGPFTFDVPER